MIQNTTFFVVIEASKYFLMSFVMFLADCTQMRMRFMFVVKGLDSCNNLKSNHDRKQKYDRLLYEIKG